MTLAEALAHFDTHVTQVSQLEGFPPRVMIVVPNEAHEIMIAALEKQIPKKPYCDEDKMWRCPDCDNGLMWKWKKYPTEPMPLENGNPYCLCCGQKIDWGVAE